MTEKSVIVCDQCGTEVADYEAISVSLRNRGYRYRRKATADDSGRRAPQVFVFPVDVVKAAQSPTSTWGKVFLRAIPDVDQYIENWS